MSTTRKIKAQSIDGVAFQLNYMEQATANDKITYWNRFLDAAASRPVDGTGGSPSANVTWTRTTSDPIQGEGSFLYSKLNGVSTQGEGVSYEITIPSGQQARMQTVRFDYRIASGTYSGGTSSTDSDLIVYMYRTTATGRLIEPSIIKLDGGVVGVNYSYQGEFQTDSDATGYRFIIFSATTSTSNFTVQFDNFYVGPSKNVVGSISTAWQSYTPTYVGLGTVTSNGAYYRKVGDSLEVTFDVTAGTTTAVPASLTLPTGISVDLTKITGVTQVGKISASATPFSGGILNSSTPTILYFTSDASNYTSGANGNTWANGTRFSGFFKVPIVGWGATATLGQDADTREVVARAELTTAQTGITNKVIPFNSVTKNTHGTFNSSTGVFTAPIAGDYYVSSGTLLNNLDGSTNARLQIRKNTSTVTDSFMCRLSGGSTTDASGYVTDKVSCNAGDTIDIFVIGDASFDISSTSPRTWVAISRAAGPSQVAASESVRSAAYRTSVQSIPNATDTILIGNLEDYDTHNAHSTSTGIFTCPAPGEYEVMASTHWGASGTGVRAMKIRKNSSTITTTQIPGLAGSSFSTYIFGSIRCVAGDTLDVVVRQDTGGAIDAYSDANRYTIINIKKLP